MSNAMILALFIVAMAVPACTAIVVFGAAS